jgi:hypothetical protein
MLLHLCQPIELRLKELGKARPNGGVTYPRANEVSKLSVSISVSVFVSLSLSLSLSLSWT